MKKRLLTALCFGLSLFISCATPVFATLQSYAPTVAPYNLRDRYDTDLFTGSASYSYPIKVPKGTNDLTPDVSLSYNSHSTFGTTAYAGMGWDLSRDYVERDANFSPGDTGDDKFTLHFKGATYDLIYVASDSRYHTKIESNLNIQKLTGGSNDYTDYWQVITPDGTKYRFGQGTNSEQVCNGRSYVYRWNLDQVEDRHINKIFYTYSESGGASYLTKIEYNTEKARVIDFTYENNPYQRQVYIQGCNITETSRLKDIKVKVNSSLVHQFDLNFATASNSGQLLQSIIERGSTGTASALPATTFEYKPEVKTWQTSGSDWIDSADIDTHLNMSAVTMADVNGDGLVDIVRTIANSTPNTTWKVLLNQGNNTWSSTFQNWVNNAPMEDARLDRSDVRLVDVTGDNLPDIVMAAGASAWKVWRNTGSSWNTSYESWANLSSYGSEHYLGDGRVTVVDVTGDGLADVVTGAANNWRVFKNLGSSWSGTPETWSTSISQAFNDPTIRMADVNGDGLPDIVRSTHSGSNATWKVWKNNGSSWNSSSETLIDNVNIDAYFENNDTVLVDANGDGLADIVRSFDNGTTDEWKVLLNQGGNWSTTYETWISSAANLDLDAHSDKVRMADVTGDGLIDIVRGSPDCACSNDTWTVWKNNGSSPDLLSAIHTSQGGAINYNYTQAITASASAISSTSYTGEYFNNTTLSGSPVLTRTDSSINFDWGNGSPDGSVNSNNFSVRWTQTRSLPAGTYLFNVRSDDGVRLFVDGELILDRWPYVTSTQVSKSLSEGSHTIVMEYNELTNTAYAQMSYQRIGFPFPLWLVSQMTIDNGMTNSQNTHDTTSYTYQNGFYKFEEKDFRGFGEVNTIESNGSKKKYFFNQDNASKGRLASMQVNDNINIPYAKVEDTWTTASSSGVFTVNLAGEKQYTYDGATASAKVKETNYTYDAYGNPTKISELGDTSVSGDERYTYNEYTASTSGWLVNTLKHTYKNASDDSTKVSETYLYYDQHSGNSDAPHFGDVTKKVDWLSGGSNPETRYQFDSYGNVSQATDANNHTTTYSYDTTKTYPTTVTNAKSQSTTYSYDLGTGNLLSQTDPNGLTTSYEYDVYGRPTKEIRPYDSGSYPTTTYTYSLDGIAPEGTLVSQREASASAGTIDIYTYTDGLGRKIQTRADAEDTSKQIVTDTFYDPTGNVLSQTVPYLANTSATFANPSAGIRDTEFTYDPLARVTLTTNPKGGNSTTTYDHWKVTNIDEKGAIKRNYFSAFDKITKVEEVNGATTSATLYTYNARDDLTQISDDRSNIFSFTYDTLSRKTAQTDPDMGTWSYGYDAMGNLTSTTDARGVTTTRTYDELNRLTLVNYPTDTDTSYLYDSGKIGTLSIATDSAGTVTYTYDNRLRKTQEARTIAGTTKTTQFSYDAADRLKTQTNPDSEVVTYSFNNQGEIESASGSASLVSNFDYNALGKITSKTFGNSVTTNYTYNSDDFRLSRIQTGSLFDKNYTYDAVGNIKTITDNLLSKTQTFTYDDLDRLKTATESAGFNYAYNYNSIGNLVTFTASGSATNYTYGSGSAIPHALTSTSATSSASIPAFTMVFQAEDYNTGGEGVGYHDYDSGNNGGAYRSDDVDISSWGTGLYKIGWTRQDEWLKYNFTATASGMYTFTAKVGTPSNNSKIHAEIDGTDVTGLLTINSSGGWDNWQNITKTGINITAGSHVLKVYFDQDSNEDVWVADMDLFTLSFPGSSGSGSSQSSYTYDANGNMTNNGLHLFEYNEANQLKRVKLASNSATLAEYTYDYTGKRIIKMNYTSGVLANTVTSWTPSFETKNISSGSASVSSIVLQAEDYNTGGEGVGYHDYDAGNNGGAYRSDGVDISSWGTGLYKIGWTRQDEWLKYNFTATTSGTYRFEAKVGSPNNNSKIHAEIDGVDVTGLLTINSSGGWDNWQTISKSGISISAGSHVLKVYFDQDSNEDVWVADMDLFQFVYESGSSSTETTVYYFANNELVAKKNPDGSRYYVHNDHLGSSSVLTNSGGTLVEATKYDPWGQVLSGGTSVKYQYTGQEKDSESGLNYYDSRYYGSTIQHFVQPDSMIPNVYDPQQLNRYAYANNNPLRYTDPTGHWSVQETWNKVKSFFSGSNNTPPPASTLGSKDLEKSLSKNTPVVTSVLSKGSSNNGNTTLTTSGLGSTLSSTSTSNNPIVKTVSSIEYAYNNRNAIRREAEVKYPNMSSNGSKQDAYRHALWMYKTVQNGNYAGALLVGVGHELQNIVQDSLPFVGRGQQWGDYKMDLYNNVVAATAANYGITPDVLVATNALVYYNAPNQHTFGGNYAYNTK